MDSNVGGFKRTPCGLMLTFIVYLVIYLLFTVAGLCLPIEDLYSLCLSAIKYRVSVVGRQKQNQYEKEHNMN